MGDPTRLQMWDSELLQALVSGDLNERCLLAHSHEQLVNASAYRSNNPSWDKQVVIPAGSVP